MMKDARKWHTVCVNTSFSCWAMALSPDIGKLNQTLVLTRINGRSIADSLAWMKPIQSVVTKFLVCGFLFSEQPTMEYSEGLLCIKRNIAIQSLCYQYLTYNSHAIFFYSATIINSKASPNYSFFKVKCEPNKWQISNFHWKPFTMPPFHQNLTFCSLGQLFHSIQCYSWPAFINKSLVTTLLTITFSERKGFLICKR